MTWDQPEVTVVGGGMAGSEAAWQLADIERELRAQLDAAKRHLPQATYTWYHMGFTSLAPEVAALAAALEAPERAAAGSSIAVDWSGPGGEGDRITLAEPGSAPTKWRTAVRTAAGNPATPTRKLTYNTGVLAGRRLEMVRN